ncbi:class I glutamine amidotransferase-like protein [Parathielavia hyrcaniae]|uniref:Class I glutamine amidotransferase-like protein n=1 Tax=Parathielavia hyrcaniae TaxID=113614 RepID=A0AAN6SWL6_9PEZI|nr:class I glutamine amidotransferase-like protein [Parathielavia hyrcaniae]
MPLRLAILEADTPVSASNARYHGYFGLFRHLFARAVSPQPVESVLALTGHDVVHNPSSEYPSLDDVDAILITGSKYNAFDDDEWITTLVEFVRKALLHDRVKIVGICFGHQIVARALGALVSRSDHGWEVSVTETRLTEKGRKLFGGRKTLNIQQMHRDQVFGVPAGAELLASTDKCPNHGFVIPNRVITVQGHPEFTEDVMGEILELRHDSGLFTDQTYRSGVARNGDHHDGVFMAQAFIKFLQNP